jgi:hypothetical protein
VQKKSIRPVVEALGVAVSLFVLGCGGDAGPAGPAGAEGPPGQAGPAGSAATTATPGTSGADGSLGVYGDGSAGAKTIDVDSTLDDANTQFSDFTVAAGKTLAVPSGTRIHVSGTFTNNGIIFVLPGATGWANADGTWTLEPGLATTAAWDSISRSGNNSVTRSGGLGGKKMVVATSLLNPPAKAGGAGGNGYLCPYPNGGGGSLVVIAKQAIVNTASIFVDGQASGCGKGSGNGGGGGGIVVLASRTSITNSGTISAAGGDGQPSDVSNGPGGGGGGGIVHLIAPAITAGTLSVGGGVAGVGGTAIPPAYTRAGGAGGGGSAGDGGNGGAVKTDGTFTAATAGSPGVVFKTMTDPTALLL